MESDVLPAGVIEHKPEGVASRVTEKGRHMARDAAVISTWGFPARGREAKATEVFMEFFGFWGKHASEGRCSEPKIYFNANGTGATGIVTGKSEALLEILESEEYQKLIVKASLIVDGLKADLYYGGSDEEIQRGTRIFAEAGAELGYM
jgi:hypothetical protein